MYQTNYICNTSRYMGKFIGVQSSNVESDKRKFTYICLRYVVEQKGLKTKIIDVEATQKLEYIFSVKTFVLYLGMYFWNADLLK